MMAAPAAGDDELDLAFMSYARVDQAIVTRFATMLQERSLRIWMDTHDIRPAAEWMKEIEAAIDRSRAFVAFLSPAYCASVACADEIQRARDAGKVIVPVVIGKFLLPPQLAWVQTLNWIHAASDAELQEAADKVIAAATADLEWSDTHSRLLLKAREWDAGGRRRTLLLRGDDIAAAEIAVAATRPAGQPQPVELHRAFVTASRTARKRRNLAVTSVAASVTALSVVLATVAVVQRSEARNQRSHAVQLQVQSEARELATRALSDKDPLTATLLALEAEYWTPTPLAEARSAWAQTTRHLGDIGAVESAAIDLSGPVTFAAWNASGDLLAIERDAALTVVRRDGTTVASSIPVGAVAWSPTADLLAATDGDGMAVVLNPDGTSHGSPIAATNTVLGWDPTGELLSVLDADATVQMYTVDGEPFGRPTPLDSAAESVEVVWNPAGTEYAIQYNVNIGDAGGYDGVHLYARDGTEMSPAIEPDGLSLVSPSWDRTGTLLATANYDGTVQVYEADGSPHGAPLGAAVAGNPQVAFSPVDDVLAVGNADGSVTFFDSDGAPLGEPAPGAVGSYVATLTWNSDGTLLAVGGGDGSVRLLDRDHVQQGAPLTTDDFTPASFLSWDPQGGSLVAVSQSGARLLDVAASSTISEIAPTGSGASDVAWNPVSATFAVGDRSGAVRLFDASGNQIGETAPPGQQPVVTMAWNPQGTLLAVSTLEGALRLFTADGTHVSDPMLGQPAVFYSDLRWNSAGTVVGDTNSFGGIAIFPSDGSSATVEYAVDSLNTSTFAWMNDDHLATLTYDGLLAVFDGTGTAIRSTPAVGHGISFGLEWSEANKTLAVGADDGTLRLIGPDGTPRTDEIVSGLPSAAGLAWNSAGTVLAVGGGSRVRLFDAHGTPLTEPIVTGSGDVTQLLWNPAGTLLATVNRDGTFRLVGAGGARSKPIDTGATQVAQVAWDPTGTLLLRRGTDERVVIDRAWDEAAVCTYLRSVMTVEEMDAAVDIPGGQSRCAHDDTLSPLPAVPSSAKPSP